MRKYNRINNIRVNQSIQLNESFYFENKKTSECKWNNEKFDDFLKQQLTFCNSQPQCEKQDLVLFFIQFTTHLPLRAVKVTVDCHLLRNMLSESNPDFGYICYFSMCMLLMVRTLSQCYHYWMDVDEIDTLNQQCVHSARHSNANKCPQTDCCTERRTLQWIHFVILYSKSDALGKWMFEKERER